jgi:FkbM family methyltransferase
MDIKKREQRIFDILQDEQSRDLFLNCCKIGKERNSCGKLSFDLFNQIAPEYENFKYFKPLDNIPITSMSKAIEIMKNHKTAIYGVGPGGIKIISMLDKYAAFDKVVAFYDKDKNKFGLTIKDVAVTPPPCTTEAEYVIITLNNNKWISETIDYFISVGYKKEHLLVLCYVNEKITYFDPKIILPRLGTEEILIDAGCYNFNTSKRLLEVAQGVKKIYAYEPDENNYNFIKQRVDELGLTNVVLGQYAWWSEDTTITFKSDGGTSEINLSDGDIIVNTRHIDGVIPEDEQVTYIKMDIEGAELEALKGAVNTIKRCRPMLAISIYHKPNDYLELIEFCLSLNPDYKVYIRQSCPYGSLGAIAYFINETTK